jgi:hypothetical protein
MIVQHKYSPGLKDFPEDAVILRGPKVLTTSYVVCDLHNGVGLWPQCQNGDIPIAHAKKATLTVISALGSLDSILIQPRFCPPYSDRLEDGTIGAVAGNVFSDAGVTFEPSDVGRHITVYNVGTGSLDTGRYRIIEYLTSTSVRLQCSPVFTASSISWYMHGAEYVEMSQVTESGKTTLTPHYYELTDDGGFIFTFPLPAMPRMRVYVKGSGTVTGSTLMVGLNLMGPGGE